MCSTAVGIGNVKVVNMKWGQKKRWKTNECVQQFEEQKENKWSSQSETNVGSSCKETLFINHPQTERKYFLLPEKLCVCRSCSQLYFSLSEHFPF